MADPAMNDLSERDFYTWTQDQAARLRALRGHDAIDAEHVAEEIADLGQERRDAVQSNIERCPEHLIKLAASPATAPRGTWTSDREIIIIRNKCEEARCVRSRSGTLMSVWRLNFVSARTRMASPCPKKRARYWNPPSRSPRSPLCAWVAP